MGVGFYFGREIQLMLDRIKSKIITNMCTYFGGKCKYYLLLSIIIKDYKVFWFLKLC